jgi:hypothetical protein
MIRRAAMAALGLGLALLAGCHSDVCNGGTCIELVVASDGTVPQVDQLNLRMIGAATYGPAKTDVLDKPLALPVTTDFLIPEGRTGTVTVEVDGLLAGAVVGEGAHSIAINPDNRVTLTVTLTSKKPRRIFLLPPHDGRLGGRDVVANTCTIAASKVGLDGMYAGVIGYAGIAGPAMTLTLNGGDREIVLTNGLLVATDSTFYLPDHLAPINLGPAMDQASQECVWTNFDPSGMARGADCAGWTDSMLLRGNYGLTDKSDVNWADFGGNTTCDALCHVYCIEQ